ncbi:MAG: 3-deoxy-7-phosphoheptulonate synthase, partial [Sphingomicrobium sp.]
MSAGPPKIDSWTPAGWRARAAAQQPDYADRDRLTKVEHALSMAPPVVAIGDCAALRALAASVADGEGLILQGGDCAETLGQPQGPAVAAIATLFNQLGGQLPQPVINIARIAGQFAKPRSNAVERRGMIALPAYRGDGINGSEFTAAARAPDPARMIAIHAQSVETAQLLAKARTGRPPIFTSHEALLLPYEQALTRRDDKGRWWATSGHMVWIGDRTRQVDGAHVEFASGIENLVGVKCGPSLGADELLRLLGRIDPVNRAGKIALIGRFGADSIERHLPVLMEATKREGRRVLWMIDPM